MAGRNDRARHDGTLGTPAAVIAERAPIGIVELSIDGTILHANPAFCRTAGRSPDLVVGTRFADIIHTDASAADVFSDGLPLDDDAVAYDARLAQLDGTSRRVWCKLSRSPEQHDIVLAFVVDRTEQRAQANWTNTDERFTKLLNNVEDVITVCDSSGIIIKQLGQFTELLGWPAGHWDGQLLYEMAHPDEVDRAKSEFKRLLNMPGVPVVGQFRTKRRDGNWAWLEFTAINLLDDPTIQAVVLISRNITAKKEADALQRNQAEVFELIACGAPLELVLTRLAQMVEDRTGGACVGVFLREGDVLRLGAGPRLDPGLVDLIDGAGPARWFGPLRDALASGRSASCSSIDSLEISIRQRSALAVSGTHAIAALPIVFENDDDSVAGALVVHLDRERSLEEGEELVAVSAARLAAIAVQRHRVELRLSHLAHHDKLTGLPNRVAMQTRLDEGIRLARTHRSSIAVMFLDLDNFKLVNDSFGHAAGDRILVGFAERLLKLLRPGDVVGRFGGDEFVVLIENVSSVSDATPVAERLLEDLRRPFLIADNTVFLTVSVGIAVSHGGRDSSEALLRNADSAMYQAKSRGRSRIEIYDEGLPERAARRLQLEGDLHRALEQHQFHLHWQPKIALNTGRIVSAEALLRWAHPERGMILPTEFIAITEELELITRVGEWVLGEAIRQRSEWESEHGDEAPWSIAVNVSALQLSAPKALETVTRVLSRWQWAPDRLVLELTESVLMDEVSDAQLMLRRLKQLGVKLAIDDFGTGYSSLSYLHRLPVDQVKLDRAFVASIEADGEGSPIARAVINMAHALGITVTAEGVETEAQLSGLRRLGCDRAQGFFLARPMPAEDFTALLRRKPRYDTSASAA